MRVYMDNNATTPIRPEVLSEMLPFLQDVFGNASSAHSSGKRAREAVEESRSRIASAIGATEKEIIFTSGGTEADNLAIQGVANLYSNGGKDGRKRIVCSAIEHPAVLESCKFLKKRGFEVEFLPVDSSGVVKLDAAEDIIDDETLLVSVMLANNEIGTIQPVGEIARIAKEHGALVHCDMVQALGKIPLNVREFGVDLASFSSHKVYGPKGVGALYIRKGIRIEPLFHGGHQERRIRPGTENPAGIVGFATAVSLACSDDELEYQSKHIGMLRDGLEQKILSNVPHAILNGKDAARVPNTLNVSFAFVEGESLSLMLDAKGVEVSTGSACSSGSLEPSHVMLAIGLSHELAHGSIRFSLGMNTTEEDVDYVASVVTEVVERLRSFSPLYEDFLASGATLDEYMAHSKEEVFDEQH